MKRNPCFAAVVLAALVIGQAAGKEAKPSYRGEVPTRTISIVVNGTPLPANPAPFIAGGRVLVPFVPVLSALAISVARDGEALVASAPTAVIRIRIGSTEAKINDRIVAMDAPAIERNGATYVTLRFIGDALGAMTNYDRQSQRVEIVSSLVGRAEPMTQGGPGGETTITGVVSAIDLNSSPPALTIVRGGNVRTISVSRNAKTTIQDVTTHTTVDGALAAIHVGDSVSVRMTKAGSVLQVLDLYASRSGKIVAVSGSSIVLADGHVVTPTRATTITLNGESAQLSDLASGDDAIVRLNPETGEAREIIASRAVADASPPPNGSPSPAVRIVSFSLDARRPLRSGESATLTLVGTPGARATYDIGSFLTGLPMREIAPGTYTARYTVQGSINFASVPVFGHLTLGTQSVRAQAQRLLSVATLPPQITEVGPSPNQTVNNPTPSIYATFSAPSGVGIDSSSASISVNGEDVTDAATRTPSFITYYPSGNMRDGRVNVTVRVADLAGNVASRSWSFTIRSH
jgi:hypothetical protein